MSVAASLPPSSPTCHLRNIINQRDEDGLVHNIDPYKVGQVLQPSTRYEGSSGGELAWRALACAVSYWNITSLLYLYRLNSVANVYIFVCISDAKQQLRLECVLYSSVKHRTFNSAFSSAVRNSFGFRFGIQFHSNEPRSLVATLTC